MGIILSFIVPRFFPSLFSHNKQLLGWMARGKNTKNHSHSLGFSSLIALYWNTFWRVLCKTLLDFFLPLLPTVFSPLRRVLFRIFFATSYWMKQHTECEYVSSVARVIYGYRRQHSPCTEDKHVFLFVWWHC